MQPSNSYSLDAAKKAPRTANSFPMLEAPQEQALAARVRDGGDEDAVHALAQSHMRLVQAIARQYNGYGLPVDDLVQEGHVGLLKAIRRFDPEQGVRLSTYAMHWIKAEINEYVLKNVRQAKIATTKAQRKIFFNLRAIKHRLINEQGSGMRRLTGEQAREVASLLNVSVEDVQEMEVRLANSDVALDWEDDAEEGDDRGPAVMLGDTSFEPGVVLQKALRNWMATDGIAKAVDTLDPRSRRIVQERWLNVNDDGSGGMTLMELADEYGISAERIRQIEKDAFKKMRKCLEQASGCVDARVH